MKKLFEGELEDTPPEESKILCEMISKMSLVQRAERFLDLNQTARELTKQGIRMRNPEFSEEDVLNEFRRICFLAYQYENKLGKKKVIKITLKNNREIEITEDHSVFRFNIEFFRGDLARGMYGVFSTSQYVSLVLIVGILIIYFLLLPAQRR